MSTVTMSSGANTQVLTNGNSVNFGQMDQQHGGGCGKKFDPLNTNGGDFNASDIRNLDRQLKQMGIKDPKARMEKMAELMGIPKGDLDADNMDFDGNGSVDGKDIKAFASMADKLGMKGQELKDAMKNWLSKDEEEVEPTPGDCNCEANPGEQAGGSEPTAGADSPAGGAGSGTTTGGMADGFQGLVEEIRKAFSSGKDIKQIFNSVMGILKKYGGEKLGVFKPA